MKETCNIIIGLRKQNAVCLRHKIQNHENIAIILVCALAYCFGVQAQSSIPHSQAGFDVEKQE